MAATARKQYDHRIRQAIVQARDPDLFPKLAIPDSTRRSWLTRGVAEVVTLDQRDSEFIELHAAVAKLEKKVAVLTAVVRLLVTLVRVAGITLGQTRLPSAAAKRRVLRAIGRAEPAVGRVAALRILGLTPARVREWTQRELRVWASRTLLRARGPSPLVSRRLSDVSSATWSRPTSTSTSR